MFLVHIHVAINLVYRFSQACELWWLVTLTYEMSIMSLVSLTDIKPSLYYKKISVMGTISHRAQTVAHTKGNKHNDDNPV